DDDIGLEIEDLGRLGEGIQPQIDTMLLTLLDAPVDDADEIAAALERAAMRTCPPGASSASSTVTRCPRTAATRAASSPAGPAPTMTTCLGLSPASWGTSWGRSASLPLAGLWMQVAAPEV